MIIFYLRLVDAYHLQRNQRIPALCAIWSHLSDDKFLSQKVRLLHLVYESDKQLRVQSLHSKFSVIGVGLPYKYIQ